MDATDTSALGPGLRRGEVQALCLWLSAAVCLGGVVFASPRFALGAALGSLFALANFRSLWRSSQRILLVGGPGAGPAVAAFGLRFMLLALVIALALYAGADPAGLLVGLSMVVPAVVVAAWRRRPPVLPIAAAPGPAPEDPSWDDWNAWLAREHAKPEEDDEA